jgi:hypothetical protein
MTGRMHMPASLNRRPATLRAKRKIPTKKKTSTPRRTRAETSLALNAKPRAMTSWLYPSLVLASFLMGILSSYWMWGRKLQTVGTDLRPLATSPDASSDEGDKMDMAALFAQVNSSDGYKLPLRYGDLGPRLLANGVIDYDAFAAVYENAGDPLTQAQVEILNRGSDEQIIIASENAHFLLNFFWAVGLANKNTILTDGPMVQYSNGQIENFASTGGWTLGTKPVTELYASVDLISLTPEQQAHVEEAASAIYRPCCNNPTLFPDCNHGMAMLGLLELMASQNASVDEMFQAAKFVNAFWFPQQALETAIYLKADQGIDFAEADPRLVTGINFSSGSGSGAVHQQLQATGLLPSTPGSGGSCGS